jgi:hypothetical protein
MANNNNEYDKAKRGVKKMPRLKEIVRKALVLAIAGGLGF